MFQGLLSLRASRVVPHAFIERSSVQVVSLRGRHVVIRAWPSRSSVNCAALRLPSGGGLDPVCTEASMNGCEIGSDPGTLSRHLVRFSLPRLGASGSSMPRAGGPYLDISNFFTVPTATLLDDR